MNSPPQKGHKLAELQNGAGSLGKTLPGMNIEKKAPDLDRENPSRNHRAIGKMLVKLELKKGRYHFICKKRIHGGGVF